MAADAPADAPEVNEDELGEGQDIFYVAEDTYKEVAGKLKESKEITKEDINKMTFPEDLPEEAMMIPVDMRGVEEEFDDVEAMVEKLGPKGAAEAFVKAREYFEKNKPEGDDCPQPMTAKEWRDVLEEEDLDMMEDLEEEPLDIEGEEEELLEEELDDEGGADAVEPDAKKAKTD